jgi:uncharacterized damage-inducible protein DinB
MDATSRASLWDQFGSTIDMLENAIRACPDDLWGDTEQQPQFWHVAFHTLFYLDFYLSDSGQGFAAPAPFTLTELDPAGVLPERVYSKTEVIAYLEHGRRKARARIDGLTAEKATQRCEYGWINLSVWESLLYNMRHVQHHAAQLNLLLRQANQPVPRWVARSG